MSKNNIGKKFNTIQMITKLKIGSLQKDKIYGIERDKSSFGLMF